LAKKYFLAKKIIFAQINILGKNIWPKKSVLNKNIIWPKKSVLNKNIIWPKKSFLAEKNHFWPKKSLVENIFGQKHLFRKKVGRKWTRSLKPTK